MHVQTDRATHTGEDALKEGISRLHSPGGKVILYVERFIIFYDSYVALFGRIRDRRARASASPVAIRASGPLSVIAIPEERGKEWSV